MNIALEHAADPPPHVASMPLPHIHQPWLETVNAPTLLNRPILSLRWSVPNLLPEGLVVLAGKPKMGKSWLALALAASVASGASFIEGLEAEQGDVLYLALEDSERRLQQRLKQVLQGADPPSALDLAIQCSHLDVGGYEQIAAWIDGHPDARLVILDTMACVRAPTRSKANQYQEDYKVFRQLKLLASEHRITLLVVHHLRKGAADDPVDEVSGSTGLTGAVDEVMVLQRQRGRQNAVLCATGRDIEEQQITLAFHPDSGRWSFGDSKRAVMHLATPIRQHSLREAILDHLRTASMPLSPAEIINGVKGNPNSIRATLALMFRDGTLHRPAWGRYALAAA